MGAQPQAKVNAIHNRIDVHDNGKVTATTVEDALIHFGYPATPTEVTEVLDLLKPRPEPEVLVESIADIGREHLTLARSAGDGEWSTATALQGILAMAIEQVARDERDEVSLSREYVADLEGRTEQHVDQITRIEDLLRGWEEWDPNHAVKIGSVCHDVRRAIEGLIGEGEVDAG